MKALLLVQVVLTIFAVGAKLEASELKEIKREIVVVDGGQRIVYNGSGWSNK